jgi:DNA-binding transcriptional MerR regulator
MSTAEAARRAGVAPGTLRRWSDDGLIPQAADGATDSRAKDGGAT